MKIDKQLLGDLISDFETVIEMKVDHYAYLNLMDRLKATLEIYNEEWISVEERLPEKNVYVLANEEEVNDCLFLFLNHYGAWQNEKEFYFGVTHWMPIPEKP